MLLPKIAPPFQAYYSGRLQKHLGLPVSDSEQSLHTADFLLERGRIIYLQSEDAFLLVTSDSWQIAPGVNYARPDKVRDDPRLLDLRERSSPGKHVPHAGAYLVWQPLRKQFGYAISKCLMGIVAVSVQRFQRGILVGPLRDTVYAKNSQVLAFLYDGEANQQGGKSVLSPSMQTNEPVPCDDYPDSAIRR